MVLLRAARLPLLLLCLAAAALLLLSLAGGGSPLAVPGIQADAVEALLLLLIGVIGLVVVVYSVRNLQGQPGLTRYAALVLLVVGALALVVVSSSLVVLALAWAVASQALAGLVGHAGTAPARDAARLLRARLVVGDLLLGSGVLVTGLWVGAWDRDSLAAAVATAPAAAVTLAALLVVGAGVVRSALVPAHRWLPETAEAPSPVSALLHAGFVNGVGVIALLTWPLVQATWPARAALLVAGLASALLGAAQVRTRGDFKGRLAASTSSQMGYLAIQVALGIPAAVLAHIVGHGVWKARKFLGAGGAVQRSRVGHRPTTRLTAPREVAACAVASVAVVVLAAVVPVAALPVLTEPAELLALAVAAAAATIAAVTVLRTAVPPVARSAALVAVSLAVVAYLVGLRALTALTAPVLGGPEPWGSREGSVLLATVAAIVAVGLAWGLVDAAARHGRLPALARRVALGSLRPWSVRERLAPRLVADVVASTPSEQDAARARAQIDVASATTATLYPLTTFVASNPLSGVEGLGFAAAHHLAAELGDALPGPSAAMLRQSIQQGAVSHRDVGDVLDASELAPRGLSLPGLPGRELRDVVGALLVDDEPEPARTITAERALRRAGVPGARTIRTPLEALGDADLGRRARELGHHLCTRSLAAATWPGAADPWSELRAHGRDLDSAVGVRGVAAAVLALPADPAAATAALLDRLGVAEVDRPLLLGRLLGVDPGWPAHVAWRNRHAVLGRAAQPGAGDVDDLLPALVATRLALEVVVAQAVAQRHVGRALTAADLVTTRSGRLARLLAADALADVDVAHLGDTDLRDLARLLAPLAEGGLEALRSDVLDGAYRRQLLDRLGQASPARFAVEIADDPIRTPEAQLVACIDVRSERLRRHLENLGPWETLGAAGFFGLPVRHVGTDGHVSERTPALVRPSAVVTERASRATGAQGMLTALSSAMDTIEATPSVVLGWAEAAGWVLAPALVLATVRPGTGRWPASRIRARLALPRTGRLDVVADVGADALADAAAAFLASTGIAEPAPLVVLLGHGATVTNNPHVAAYDCGACGGAAGDVSARVMATALNDERVRDALRERGVAIPTSTRFVAALHDTTTDDVRVLDRDSVPSAHRELLARLEADLRSAGDEVRAERTALLPDAAAGSVARLRAAAVHRAADWAQPRPEWGLAGAAAMVVGPRSLTRDTDLDGRVFLQSYRPDLDPDATVLAGLLEAPVVVAHWITAQYRASTLDPHHFGAGDKTTHNVMGHGHELSAVVTGARGDLRLGLPWQAVSAQAPTHDQSSTGHPWRTASRHVPHRLLVLVAADVEQAEAALARSPEVTSLVTGEWITLCAIDLGAGAIARRRPDGAWVPEGGVPLGNVPVASAG